MSYDPNDYNRQDPEREEREAQEREQESYDERLKAFDAGLCSRRAAVLGGSEYLRDLAETAIELKAAGCAIPESVAAAPVSRAGMEPRTERSAA
jgi:hypothetical protein